MPHRVRLTTRFKTATETSAATVRRSRRAMTLIEVLVASVLLGVGVVGLLSTATLALRNQQRTEQRAAALYLAQERLAEVELVGPYVWSLGRPAQGTQSHGGVDYEWTIRVDQLAVGELFSVLVDVRWSTPGGSGNVALETWLNDYQAVALESSEQPAESVPGNPMESPNR